MVERRKWLPSKSGLLPEMLLTAEEFELELASSTIFLEAQADLRLNSWVSPSHAILTLGWMKPVIRANKSRLKCLQE
jgi:hypothetical protein